MRILIVCASISGGGAERVAINLSSHFVKSGHEVVYFYWRSRAGENYNISQKVDLVRAKNQSFLARIIGLVSVCGRYQPDAIISFTDVPNMLVGIAKKISRVGKSKFVTTVHNDLRARDEGRSFGLKETVYREIHRKSLLLSDSVICVSKGAKQTLIDYYRLGRKPVTVIYNPVIKNPRTKALRPDRLAKSKVRFVAAGRMVPQKNYEMMLQAVAKAKQKVDIKLDIFGSGPLRDRLESLVLQLGLQENITFRGFVDDLDKKLSTYDVFLMSSKWEGFGNVLVEALHSGLYVISTNCPSGPEEVLMGGKFGRLVSVGSSDEMADAIVDYANGHVEKHSESELAEHLMKFSHEAVGDHYLHILKSIVYDQ